MSYALFATYGIMDNHNAKKTGFNEEELKYEVLLERVTKMVEEKTEEVAKVLENLIKEETGEIEG